MKQIWNNVKDKLQQAYPDLTPEDLEYTEGKEVDFICRIESKTGHTITDIIEYINGLEA